MWIIRAWQCISQDETVSGFKKRCISNVVDGTDDMLWNGNEEDGNVRTVRKIKALTEDGDSDTEW